LGSQDEEDQGSRPARAKSSCDPFLIEKTGHVGMYLSSKLWPEAEITASWSKSAWGIKQDPSSKKPEKKGLEA
jgi:hypothetical protein